MRKSKQIRVSVWQRVWLIILGVFISFIILEVGLRTAGFLLLSLQEYKNRLSLKQRSAYRILCLGESTTQGQYPVFLEKILNQRNIGIKFSVIDKGFSSTTTNIILSQLEANLSAYKPDMVVAMMGVNDIGLPFLFDETADGSRRVSFFTQLRIYKLLNLLWRHIETKTKEMKSYGQNEGKRYVKKSKKQLNSADALVYEQLCREYRGKNMLLEAEEAIKKSLELNPRSDSAYVELGDIYRHQIKFTEAEEAFKQALKLDSENDLAYVLLGILYKQQKRIPEAEKAFNKTLELNPGNSWAYAGLGDIYENYTGKLSEAEQAFKRVLEIEPQNDFLNIELELSRIYMMQGRLTEAKEVCNKILKFNSKSDSTYMLLGQIFSVEGRPIEAEQAFKKSLELNPENTLAYMELGNFYRNDCRFLESEQTFRKSLEYEPYNARSYVGLGTTYIELGKLSEAEEVFKKAIKFNPRNYWAHTGLESIYFKTGNNELFKEYMDIAKQLKGNGLLPKTVKNYLKLKQILDKRNIRLVCAQYPMQNIAPLKKIFKGQRGVIFVDNEEIFKKNVENYGYKAYFRDMFAGEFGHCTDRGNELLAENIAGAILNEVFKK